jgi:hypothetical protein
MSWDCDGLFVWDHDCICHQMFLVFESDERRIVALSRLPVSTFANGYDLRGFDAPHFS